MRLKPMFIRYAACTAFSVAVAVALCQAQEPAIGVPVPRLGVDPFVLDSAEQHKIRVTVLARGLSHPWAIAFLPDGGMLITERAGRLRVFRNGALDPKPITGVPQVRTDGNGGLMDVKDLVVPDALEGNGGLNGRIVFGHDGMLYMSTGGNVGQVSQDPT